MIIPMLCVTIFVILVVWFLLPRVARLMIHTPTAISIFVCLSMVQLMADRKSGSAGMPRPISYAVFCLKKKSKYAILSDILGDEDHLGDMDFKVCGTRDGITACQMDLKVDGLPYEVMAED